MDLALGAVASLAPKVGELLREEYVVQTGLKPDIESLSRELVMLKAALDDASFVPLGLLSEVEKLWARQVRELSYDMEDAVDNIILRLAGDESATAAAAAAASVFKRIHAKATGLRKKVKDRHQISSMVKDIKKLSNELAELRAKYTVRGMGSDLNVSYDIDPRVLNLYKKESDLIGIEESRDQVIRMLGINDAHVYWQSLKIVSIVGTGGLGKTTLALSVYNKVKSQFDSHAFISVGWSPRLTNIFTKILMELDHKYKQVDMTRWDEQQFLNELHNFMEGKRYLIVIDDIWEKTSWQHFAHAFGENNCEGRIIVTTRIFQVASEAGEIYRMKPLSYMDSKRLLYKRLFCEEEDCPNKDVLAEVSDKIVKKSGGVPLAIIEAASLLAERPIEDWLKVIGVVSDGYNTMKVSSFSYYDLPIYLRPCFLYLSIYPEGHVIEKNMLIWRWIAEGFVYGDGNNELFELGESYFNELINKSLIQPVDIKGAGLIYGCQVHCLVLQLIRYLSSGENFISILKDEGGEKFPSSKSRWLAIHNRKEGHTLGDNMNLLHPQLRSLTASECPIYMIPPVICFKLLRVLDLESCGSMEGYDLKHLGKLLLLRYVGLRNTFVRMLPEELGHLKMLQTLDLQGSGVEDLPASMGEVTSLMCLNADWTTRVADWIHKLTSLQQLVMYPGHANDEHSVKWLVTGLGNLMELRVLRLLIIADDDKQLTQLLESVFKLPKIEALCFDYNGAQLNRRVKLEPSDFACSGHLRSLELQLLEFSRLPEWLNAFYLPQICHLSLLLFDMDQKDLENLGAFKELGHLHLLIVNTARSDAITCASGGFRKLRFFSITKPFKFLQEAMPMLEILDFHFNVRLKSDLDFDFGLENIPSLQQVIVQINCLDAFSEEVEKVKAALRHATSVHPNCPIIDISLSGRKLDKADNVGVNVISNRDKGKGVETAEGRSKLAYYSKSLSSANEGIDKPMDELIKRLYVVDNEAYDKKMKIVPIVRSEGLEKTTLAQKVFDKLSPHFDCAAFVLVGQNPDMRKVFTDILIGLDKEKYQDFHMTMLDLMELLGLVRKSLINKRFFVVVDDIWDLKAWGIIKSALIENSNGSAVLTTTSQNWRPSGDYKSDSEAEQQLDPPSTDLSPVLDVTTPVDVPAFSPSKKPHVEISEEPDSPAFAISQIRGTKPEVWFYEVLFGSEDNCPDDLKDICKDLIDISGGLESEVFSILQELGDIPNKKLEDWQCVYQTRKFKLSYPKLPGHLKDCLRYYSMFPKGYEISAGRIVWAWIAQGLVKQTKEQNDLEKIGKNYLSDLIDRKIIEAVEVHADGMAVSCRAYDLLHDLIVKVSISEKEKFVEILNDSQEGASNPNTKVHRLSIQIQRNNMLQPLPKPWLKQVQSLVVSSETMPDLSDFEGLHAMDLGGCDSLQVDHLKGISKNLIYLAIGGKYIAAIPKEVSGLKKLRTLDLTGSGLSELPRCVLWLTNLERLFVNSHMKIPGKIAKMSGLEELGAINVDKPELINKLRRLKNLKVLRIAIWSWDEGSKSSVKQCWDALQSLLLSCKNIENLSILTFCFLDFMDGSGDNKWPPQTLKNLEIRHSAFLDKLPSWFDSLSTISSLTIEVNKLSENIIYTLGKLSTLRSLSLTSIEEPEPEVRFVIGSANSFEKLESLKFVSNEMVKVLETPESNATQLFTSLTIVFQASRTAHGRNNDFRFGLDKLPSLEQVRVEINCSNATRQMVSNAVAAIEEEISKIRRDDRRRPNLEIRRLQEESIIAEEDQTTAPQVAKPSSSSTMESHSQMPSVHGVSKVHSQNCSNDTFFQNVGILTSSTKIKTLKERALQELTNEKQGSTALHQEVDELKKKLMNTQREFEEFKKQQEENNQFLKQILHSNNTIIS